MVTAGHCAFLNERMRRRNHPEPNSSTVSFGETTRRGYDSNAGTLDTDASAIRLKDRNLTPRYIYTGKGPAIPIRGVVQPRLGMVVCQSGVTSNDERCGKITRLAVTLEYEGQKMLQVEYNADPLGGDSGGPVWQKGTYSVVGIVTAGSYNDQEEEVAPGYFTPLLPMPGRPDMPGVFGDLSPLHLFTTDCTCN
jgi:hypothetical protein